MSNVKVVRMVMVGDSGDVSKDISNATCNYSDHQGGQTISSDIKQYQTISNDIKQYHIEGFESDGLSTRARLNNIKQTCDL